VKSLYLAGHHPITATLQAAKKSITRSSSYGNAADRSSLSMDTGRYNSHTVLENESVHSRPTRKKDYRRMSIKTRNVWYAYPKTRQGLLCGFALLLVVMCHPGGDHSLRQSLQVNIAKKMSQHFGPKTLLLRACILVRPPPPQKKMYFPPSR
jgi:hypothetical protein